MSFHAKRPLLQKRLIDEAARGSVSKENPTSPPLLICGEEKRIIINSLVMTDGSHR